MGRRVRLCFPRSRVELDVELGREAGARKANLHRPERCEHTREGQSALDSREVWRYDRLLWGHDCQLITNVLRWHAREVRKCLLDNGHVDFSKSGAG